jgi:hypothetical protein
VANGFDQTAQAATAAARRGTTRDWTPAEIGKLVARECKKTGCDPDVVLAVIDLESGFNERAEGDIVNGRPTSFGLRQLHRGGALGSRSPEWAKNPANVVPEMARVFKGVRNGAGAARKQRPANPTAYAAQIDQKLAALRAFRRTRLAQRRAGGASGGGANLQAMIAKMNEIDAAHFPYRWGGGHNAKFRGPYDCSGAVSAVLHAGGLLSSARVSGQFALMYAGGPGQSLTIYANATHVFLTVKDGGAERFWGTSNENPGGGAGWHSARSKSGFAARHPRGL